jgi:hypothetical protein
MTVAAAAAQTHSGLRHTGSTGVETQTGLSSILHPAAAVSAAASSSPVPYCYSYPSPACQKPTSLLFAGSTSPLSRPEPKWWLLMVRG